MKLFQRIKMLCDDIGVSQTSLAKTLGLRQPQLHGYLNEKSEKNLWPLLPALLAAHPDISRAWLYFGEGPMLTKERFPPGGTAINRRNQPLGELLRATLDFAAITPREAAGKTGIDGVILQAMLESRIKPDFDQLEAFFEELRINPVFFFDGNEKTMFLPKDGLLRVMWALGRLRSGFSGITLSEIFGVPLEEAREFYREWQELRESGQSRALPPHWEENFCRRYAPTPDWLRNAVPPLFVERDNAPQSNALGENIDYPILEEVVEMLEKALAATGTELDPKPKARAIRIMHQIRLAGVSKKELSAVARGLTEGSEAVND